MNLEFTSDILMELIKDESYTATNYPSIYQTLKCGGLQIRPLEKSDISTNYMDLLGKDDSITASNDMRKQQLKKYFNYISISNPWMYYNIIIEDTKTSKLIGTACLIVEQKFIHDAAIRSRIENLIVSETHRNCGFEVLLLETLSLLAERFGCYKVNMGCPIKHEDVCVKLGLVYEKGQNIMAVKTPQNKVCGPA